MIERHGDERPAELLPKLRCQECGDRPEPDWAIELVPVDAGAASHIGKPFRVQ